ncbi:hypothetical protein Tco_0997244 [Tanacetum coccineum]
MDNTRAQQKALDDELVAPADLALDALKLTPFYNAFEISADVPKIYMQEFWVTVSRHHSSLRFKLNGKSHTVNVDNFRDMLKICPKLPGQIFEEPPLEEEILSFIRDLGHTGEIKFLSDVNELNFMFTTVRVSSKHQDTQVYGVVLPQHLTNQAMLESEAYMTYRAYATGEKIPKPKTTKKKADSESSPKTKRFPYLSKKASKGDGVDIQSKVPDEQQQNISGTNEGAGDKPKVLDVPEYRSKSEEESWTYSQGEDDGRHERA